MQRNPHLFSLARIIHKSATPTAVMAVLPGVLGSRTLRRTVQVRLGYEILRLPGGTPIFTVSRRRFRNDPGYGGTKNGLNNKGF